MKYTTEMVENYSFGEHSTWNVLGSRGSIEVAFGTTSKDTPYEGTDSTVH